MLLLYTRRTQGSRNGQQARRGVESIKFMLGREKCDHPHTVSCRTVVLWVVAFLV